MPIAPTLLPPEMAPDARDFGRDEGQSHAPDREVNDGDKGADGLGDDGGAST
jgi:hypothetical protein